VRAYPQGEGAGDEGWLVTAELRYRVSDGLQLKIFHDQGGLTLDKRAYTTGDNHLHLGGSGVGMDVDSPWRHLTIGLALAWRSTGEPQSDADARPRFWGQMAWHF
jgi:hemolysin activation/secretion protein